MIRTQRIRVFGIVQGVGFRPTVARHAATAGIRGTVCNKGPYVEIVAQGNEEQLSHFGELLRTQPPRRASIIKIDVRPLDATPVSGPDADKPDRAAAPAFDSFSIVESERTRGAIFVSPDIAICDDCARELYDPSNRRYLHPFINCTCCGPRLTILDALPYDRERTSMRAFPMCPTCAREYHGPASRRYDAQPVCCNDCGPEVYLLDRPERGRDAITQTRRIVADGGIVAIKGIGGFHLCCDATNAAAVELLRTRKRRPTKPFAVMARNLEAAQCACEASPLATDLLCGHQKPILLLPRRKGSAVCETVAPRNPKLGIMLPYTPLHLLLFDYDDGIAMPDYLVMTSANESGAPICRTDEDARTELTQLTDAILSHNRTIRMRADDTVLDLFEDKPYMVRRSRGWSPLPTQYEVNVPHSGLRSLACPGSGGVNIPHSGVRSPMQVIAVGGELKNAFCLGAGDLFYPSPYVGDLADVRTVHACEEAIDRMQTLLELEPQAVACDLHPLYNSTRVATDLAQRLGVPLVPVQHHYAHVVSCMAENDVHEPVIGVALDGTGYGTDGTVWGGEILHADLDGFERMGHIAPFALAGGDVAAREGWRPALALLAQLYGADEARNMAAELGLCSPQEARLVLAMIERNVNTVSTTSAGRLFDAVSALLGICRASSYEGEAATQLQFAAERARATASAGQQTPVADYLGTPENEATDSSVDSHANRDANNRTAENPASPFVLPTDKLFAQLVEGMRAHVPTDALALAFHKGLARLVEQACLAVRADTGTNIVALSGGCYQNLLLLELSVSRLRAQGFRVLTHSLVPPNDGGIALGQAVVAARQLSNGEPIPQWGTLTRYA